MGAARCVIGVDIGTTSTKAILYDHAGSAIAQHSVEYPLLTPTPGAAEQDPEQILRAVIDAIAQVACRVDSSQIACVSFSAAMHSLIVLDAAGEALTRCITWAIREAPPGPIVSSGTGGEIYRRTGTPIHPMSPLVKLCGSRKRSEHSSIAQRTSSRSRSTFSTASSSVTLSTRLAERLARIRALTGREKPDVII